MSAATTTYGAGLAALYTRAGLPCEVEAGPRCIIVYGAQPGLVATIAARIADGARMRDPGARVEAPPSHDADEPAATSWWASVAVDWDRF